MPTAEVNVRLLLALSVVIAAASVGGWAVSKIGQPRVLGELVVGILLGASLLGAVSPDALVFVFPSDVVSALSAIAQIGVVLFMFLIGLELDVSLLRGQRHRSLVISLASIVVPMVLGVAVAVWLYPRLGEGGDRLGFTLFFGAAMAVTAFPVLARVLRETGLQGTRIGVLAMTCAAIDDVAAWCLLAVVIAIVQSSGVSDALWTVMLSLLFIVGMLKVCRPILSRFAVVPLWFTVCLALISAWITEQIGIHAIFGAFLAGVAMPRTRAVERLIHQRLEPVVVALLLPVFFVVVGLETKIGLLDTGFLWVACIVVIVTATVSKLGGAMLAARSVGETWRDAASIGILLNTRGLTELVILTVGRELDLIGGALFTIGVLMALVTTLMAPPLLALVSPLYHREPTAGSDDVLAFGDGAPPAPGVEGADPLRGRLPYGAETADPTVTEGVGEAGSEPIARER